MGEGTVKSIFVANLLIEKNEGIYKKIFAEASALGKAIGENVLIIKDLNGTRIINPINGDETVENINVLQKAKQLLRENEIKILYIRLMIPNSQLISLMKFARKKGTKVLYEIPTYPYFAEQYRSSRRKYRALAKIAIDAFFSPLIYKYCDHMVVIKSNTNIKLKPKMIEITNGVKTDLIRTKKHTEKKEDIFRMVTVGTLYPYHGYDRILQGLYECDEQVEEVPIEFHIIGTSNTIDDLKEKVKELKLKRVFFHGTKNSEELNEMFEEYDVGLGCLALHRRNANIDTTLKVIEYYCRGIPVVTSGRSPYEDETVTIRVPDNEERIVISDIYHSWKEIPAEKLSCLAERAKKQFNWDFIFSELIEKII